MDIVDLAWSIAASQESKKGNKQGKLAVSEASGLKIDIFVVFLFLKMTILLYLQYATIIPRHGGYTYIFFKTATFQVYKGLSETDSRWEYTLTQI